MKRSIVAQPHSHNFQTEICIEKDMKRGKHEMNLYFPSELFFFLSSSKEKDLGYTLFQCSTNNK